jgi:hypothetical protein
MCALNGVRDIEQTIFADEQAWMEGDVKCRLGQRVGFMYGAWNPSINEAIVKIGATMRSSPLPRLKELSRTLPCDYQLICVVASTRPFELEKRAHAFFADKRVWRESTGRSTEFFLVDHAAVDAYFTRVAQEELGG